MSMTTWPPNFPNQNTPLWLNPNLTASPAPQEGTPSEVTVDIAYTDNTSSLGSTAQFYAFDPNILTATLPWSSIVGAARAGWRSTPAMAKRSSSGAADASLLRAGS